MSRAYSVNIRIRDAAYHMSEPQMDLFRSLNKSQVIQIIEQSMRLKENALDELAQKPYLQNRVFDIRYEVKSCHIENLCITLDADILLVGIIPSTTDEKEMNIIKDEIRRCVTPINLDIKSDNMLLMSTGRIYSDVLQLLEE